MVLTQITGTRNNLHNVRSFLAGNYMHLPIGIGQLSDAIMYSPSERLQGFLFILLYKTFFPVVAKSNFVARCEYSYIPLD